MIVGFELSETKGRQLSSLIEGRGGEKQVTNKVSGAHSGVSPVSV